MTTFLFDLQVKIISTNVFDSVRFSVLSKRHHAVFGINSKDNRLNRQHKIFRFFLRHIEKVNWYGLSSNPSIPLAFFEKHLDKIDWYRLSSNPSVPFEFFEKHLDKSKLDWTKLQSFNSS